MIGVPGINPAAVAEAYSRTDQGTQGTTDGATDFGAVLQRAIGGAIETGQDAETKATEAIAGGGSLTEVVTALSRAELALQSATAIRDRVVQAYQDIMKMPI